MDFLPDFVNMENAVKVSAWLGVATGVAALIAPLTATDKDDKLLKALRWLQSKLDLVGLAGKLGRRSVPLRDHRSK